MTSQNTSKVRLFADDTAVYLVVSNLEHAQILQADLERLAKWSLEWDMEFNPSKCTVIHVTRSKFIFHSQYTIYGHVLDYVSSSKYLGVTLNDHLTWNHIQNTVTSANKTLGFLSELLQTCKMILGGGLLSIGVQTPDYVCLIRLCMVLLQCHYHQMLCILRCLQDIQHHIR